MTQNHHEAAGQDDEIRYLGEESHYSTSDLGACGALICAGFPLVALDRTTNRNRVEFVFRRESGLDRILEHYWAGSLEVRARLYFDTLKMLKSRIYAEQ